MLVFASLVLVMFLIKERRPEYYGLLPDGARVADTTEANLVDQGKNNIVVDLEKVDFLDSTGLGVLVGGLKRVKQNNGELGIICNQEKILRIFRITGLTKVFPIYASRQDLIAKTKEA